jgi:hypothetical protein
MRKIEERMGRDEVKEGDLYNLMNGSVRLVLNIGLQPKCQNVLYTEMY